MNLNQNLNQNQEEEEKKNEFYSLTAPILKEMAVIYSQAEILVTFLSDGRTKTSTLLTPEQDLAIKNGERALQGICDTLFNETKTKAKT